MTSIQLPPINFDNSALRLSLFSPLTADDKRTSTASATPVAAPALAELESQPAPSRPPPPPPRAAERTRPAELDASPTLKIAFEDNAVAMPPPSEPVQLSQWSQPPQPPQPAQPAAVPTHPISEMQEAFAESLEEVTLGAATEKPKLREVDARERRERLLEQGKDDEPFDARWRYRPGQQQHEVFKLIAQISFGVYLMLNGMANDNTQVVTILQGHISEVDEFLEVTLEDLNQATRDLNERLEYLQLPMANGRVFEEMLEDRNYRAEILEGNEKIDHVLGRTNAAMKQWDDDVDAGLQCTTAFQEWLNGEKNAQWRNDRPDLVDIFDAMKGNADGWISAFDDMNAKTQEMNSIIIRLMTIMAEIEKKAGEISRKTWSTIPPFSSPASSSPAGSRREASSISTPRSPPRSTKNSVRSGSISTVQMAKGFDEDLQDLALPGALPLLPPPRTFAKIKRPSVDSGKLKIDTHSTSKPSTVPEAEEENEATGAKGDETLYILQPRTYTPQPPEPLPSPMLRGSTSSGASGSQRQSGQSAPFVPDRSSMRHQASQKAAPPRHIQIPPRPAPDRQNSNSPRFASPRNSGRESSIDSEIENFRQNHLPRMSSHADLGRHSRNPLVSSPSSDMQYYRPVRASPHSPLQQRPHTSSGRQTSGYFSPQHVRNQPSRLGGMSTLSTVESASQTVRPHTPGGAHTIAGGKSLKKKKSAFGWLKKAFTMDDDEKAQFENRKQMQYEEIYYKDKSPKFLDGRRIR